MAIQNGKEAISGLTREDLLAIISEIRKPVKTEKELADEEQQLRSREAMQETLKQAEANRLHRIKTCSHMRANGSTTSVFITDLNKLYCQACAGWIDPNIDVELFNKLYQLAI